MSTFQKARRPVKPVSGTCRWIKYLQWPFPGVLQINGTAYTVTALTNEQTGQIEGYRLVKQDGTTYDVDAHWWTCDCPDAVYRNRECKHVKALRAALAVKR
jgi:hypothetical protein